MNIELMSEIVDYGVLGLLAFMSFLTLFFWLERLFFYRSVDVKKYKTVEELEIDVTNNLSIISSFGANAPYIGLLGTVLGIIITFHTMGQTAQMDVQNIMTSLALALKATAMGLVVAIPAIFFYNHLNRKVEVLINKWIIHQKEN
ncbi:MAG: Ferric siderophore transport system, biopolymer transport protein ExbB [uncultured Sulfurovum sp.]|uniref:Ferric siderophore transport system, biopolymer transport protein ExbB n=1 Tax=uncultured Sulfurovum sp. TaxID=269237 RepID=A0A6S6S8L9_9BACT|nr:MAG: Ferric siderophore transport system, biopolymer transport protein ExbB [uncultured Sulfurovum sp.]